MRKNVSLKETILYGPYSRIENKTTRNLLAAVHLSYITWVILKDIEKEFGK